VTINSMHSADVRICQSSPMGNITRLHEGQDMIPMLGITKHHHLLSTKTIHPEVRSSKVISEKHTLFSTIIMSRICYMRMLARQVARDIRAKNMQIFDQVVTHLVRLEAVQLFPHRQAVGIRPISAEATEVTQRVTNKRREVTHRVRSESTRQVGTGEKSPNEFFADSDRPLSSRIFDMCI
jgi:hypothetical protein